MVAHIILIELTYSNLNQTENVNYVIMLFMYITTTAYDRDLVNSSVIDALPTYIFIIYKLKTQFLVLVLHFSKYLKQSL